jgi:MYXO-CTERM domain-containing protein
MRFRTLVVAAALSAGFAPFKGADRPFVTPTRAARTHRDISWQAPRGRLASLPSSSQWSVMWDRDTDVPSRLWGPALAAPGTSADPAAAETFARAQLSQHLDLLAPGSAVSDFTLVANTLDRGGLRTVAFAQHYRGLDVVGARVAFTFGHDKLTLISSSALPNIDARMPSGSLAPDTIGAAARSWLASDGFKVAIKAHDNRVVMPIVHARGTRSHVDIEYRVAEVVEAESVSGAGTWQVWIDAQNASPIARKSTLHFATGKLLFDVPDRYPGSTRSDKPAPAADVLVNGMATTSGPDGSISWTGTTAATVAPSLTGPLVNVLNMAGTGATDSLTLQPSGTVTWSKATDEYADAQLIGFVAASEAKQFVRERLNPSLTWLDSQIDVYVNEDDLCNAYSDGDSIHFFRSGTTQGITCENTGRITDVVYHELGHSVHAHSIIEGEGNFDDSLSEGLADTLAAAITGDHGMGRGFFKTSEALRDLDPAHDKVWPTDTDGEPHDDGEIIGQTLWDLRVALQAQFGDDDGFDKFLSLYYGVMQHAADIPTAYIGALVADDDDGDLANGTPNMCLINDAFSAHGLGPTPEALGFEPPTRTGFDVALAVHPRQFGSGCEPPTVDKATLTWKVQGGQAGGNLELASDGDGTNWTTTIPSQPDGSIVRWTVSMQLSNGKTLTYPDNPADPTYQFYIGNVKTLWCADFENGIGDWSTTGTRVEWEAGAPQGIGGDPTSAHGGTSVLGIDLGSDDGMYQRRSNQAIESPAIDLQGYTNVHLQYYRWLNVEDGVYDEASITANGQVAWKNFTSPTENTAGVTHTDKEWRFHDVDLTPYAAAGTMTIGFDLTSDSGVEYGGWTVDDVCVVAIGAPSDSCDPATDPSCEMTDDSGCCSAGGTPASGIVLSLLTLGLLWGRRRRS